MLEGILLAVGLGLNLALMSIYLYLLVLLRFLLPVPAWRQRMNRRVDAVIDHAVDINRWLFDRHLLDDVQVTWQGRERLSRHTWFLLLPNHQSWVDIILLQNLLRDSIAPLKFFNKRSLIWLPLVGFAMHLLGFPYLRRYSREQIRANPALREKDRQSMQRAVSIFEKRPTGIMIFAEGTRFTAQKHAAQESPHQHLLAPRTGGVATVLQGMGTRLEAVLDVTILYLHGPPSFWGFLCGRMGPAIFDVRVLPLPESVSTTASEEVRRRRVQDWLEELWRRKDARIEHALRNQS